MSVKDRAKMFSSTTSDKDLQKGLISSNNNSKKCNICSSLSKCFSDLKKKFQDLWKDKKMRYILIGVVSFIILLIIIIIIVSISKSSTHNVESYTGEKYEKPICTGVCSKPYDILVYTDGILRAQLKDCGYKENSELFNFALNAIKRHNVVRACHNANPLKFNCEIMKISQDYSKHLANDVGSLIHSKHTFHGDYMGENLAYVWNSGSPSGETPTNMWYSEIKYYDYNNPGFSMDTGHFTQVVWKASKEFGIGVACAKNECYMTGNYYPGGNFGSNSNYAKEVQAPQ